MDRQHHFLSVAVLASLSISVACSGAAGQIALDKCYGADFEDHEYGYSAIRLKVDRDLVATLSVGRRDLSFGRLASAEGCKKNI